MVKYVPQKEEFNKAITINKWYIILQYVSIIASLLPTIAHKLTLSLTVDIIIVSINIIILVLIFAAELYRDHRINHAENIRRDTLIDNAFGSKLSEEESVDYYNNEDIGYGYKKLLSNICQNSMFSDKISEIMLKRSFALLITLFIAIIVSGVIGFVNFVFASLLIQSFLSTLFLKRTIQIGLYKCTAHSVYEKSKSLLEEPSRTDGAFISNVLRLLIKYESNVSRFQLILDEKTYNKINPELTKKWEAIKIRYIN